MYSTKVNEGAIAGDDMETSVYYVKDALDANVTYAAAPHTAGAGGQRGEGSSEGSEEGERWEDLGTQGAREDIDTPDIGEGRDMSLYLSTICHCHHLLNS